MRESPPCKSCSRRSLNCHSKCLEYIDWAQKREVERNYIRKEKEAGSMICSMRNERKAPSKSSKFRKHKRKEN